MKVLRVESGMHLYGGALQVTFLMRGLRERGIDCVLACPEGSAIAQAAAPLARVCPRNHVSKRLGQFISSDQSIGALRSRAFESGKHKSDAAPHRSRGRSLLTLLPSCSWR